MSQLNGKNILLAAVLLLATFISANAQSEAGITSIFPEQIQSWVEVKVDSLNGAEALVQVTAAAALDSIANAQNVKYDRDNVKYHMTYFGIWTEMEGRGRRAKPVQKGFIMRMKAIASILKEN